MLEEWWRKDDIVGKLGCVFSKKLKALNKKLKVRAKNKFGKLEERINHWEFIFEHLELKEENQFLSEKEIQQKDEAYGGGKMPMRDNELFWAHKAHCSWKSQGDKCTKYFHKVVNARKNLNRNSSLLIDGYLSEDIDEIKEHIVSFYKELYI